MASMAAPAELVERWGFEEGRGGRTVGALGGEALAHLTAWCDGVKGSALWFFGYSWVKCGRSPKFDLREALTIEAWVWLSLPPKGGYATVVRKEGAYALRFEGKRPGFVLWFGGKPVRLEAERGLAPRHHLAAVFDGRWAKLFVDGKEAAAMGFSEKIRVDTSEEPLHIGGVGWEMGFVGAIDEVKVYGRDLSPEEVRASYLRGLEALEGKPPLRPPSGKGAMGPLAKVFLRRPPERPKEVVPGFIWIETEEFEDYGGWVLDTQFVHLMGSPYLIAAGAGRPVEDATTRIRIPKAGRWRLWVRCRNWLKDYSPGRFRVIVGGRPSKVLGAAPVERWTWELAGEFDLPEGEVELKLRDLTGYYGRCDALLLTLDEGYRSPEGLDELERERARLTGRSLEPKHMGKFDVVVVGGGIAGCVAAIASARMGAKTALIQNRPVLGGNASDELGVSVDGAAGHHPFARETGIIEELGKEKARWGLTWSEVLKRATEKEPNLSVFLNWHVYNAVMKDETTIGAVMAVNTLTGERTVFEGKVFVDSTGDGWVGYYAGAEYRVGRESKDEFDESLAPENPDKITMSGCIMGGSGILGFLAVDTGRPVEFKAPPWAPKLPPPERFGRRIGQIHTGNWWLEHPGEIDDLWDAEKARDKLIRISFAYWDFLKNRWHEREKVKTYELVWVPIGLAKRETRRLVGDYILTQNDVQAGRIFPDAVAYGGWPIDVHHPKGIFSDGEGPFHCNVPVPIYTIPFRCLYSRNIRNLLVACRAISVTHIALGTVRVQATLATVGQAAGTAAAMCAKYDITPRELLETRIRELQRILIREGAWIPGFRNEDPEDLALKAEAVASSTWEVVRWGREEVKPAADLHQLNVRRAMMLPVGRTNFLKVVYLLLRSEREEDVRVRVGLRAAKEPGDFSSREDLAVAEAEVPPERESWVRFEVNCQVDSPYFWVWLSKAEGISWRLMRAAPRGSHRAYEEEPERWRRMRGFYSVYTEPPIEIGTGIRPENVINGLTRPLDEKPNLWASDPQESLPQWIELRWKEPVEIGAVYLTFDTNLDERGWRTALVPECVRDYELLYHGCRRWVSIVKVEGNYQRRRVHRFEPIRTRRLRLVVHATNGDRSARVFEIRAYGPSRGPVSRE